MRILFRVGVVGMMVFLAAGLIAVFRASFSWPFRLMMAGFGLLGIYFGWLLLNISAMFGIPRPVGNSSDQGYDMQSTLGHPLVRRAIWVLLAAGALLVTTIVLGVTGIIH